MKITICGSTAFILEMETVLKELKALRHQVKMPPIKFVDGDGKEWQTLDYYKFKKTESSLSSSEFLKNHTQRIRDHFNCVEWSDAVLITNYDKNNIPNYIGPNTLMEMGLAFYLKKKIYLLNSIPNLAWKEEIIGTQPVVINGDLEKII